MLRMVSGKHFGITTLLLILLAFSSMLNIYMLSNRQTKTIPRETYYGFLTNNENKDITTTKEHKKGLAVNQNNGLLLDWWQDMCFKRVTWEKMWHPLFPNFPHQSSTVSKTGDDKLVAGNNFRRIYGFLFIEQRNEVFDFRLSSRDGAEVLVIDTGLPLGRDHQFDFNNLKNKKETLYLKLTKSLMDDQDRKIKAKALFHIEKQNILLEGHRLYFIEIIQGGRGYAKYNLQWRQSNKSGDYKTIDQENLKHASKMRAMNSMLQRKYDLTPKFKVEKDEEIIMAFHKYPILETDEPIHNSHFKCPALEKKVVKIKKDYDGYTLIDETKMYPKQWFSNPEHKKDAGLLLDQKTALSIADQVFEKLLQLHKNILESYSLVHIQSNSDIRFGKNSSTQYYFIELDIKLKPSGAIHRASHFVNYSPSGELCFMTDHQWKPSMEINLITPIKNQKPWFLYLVNMLKELVDEMKEVNVNLILVDFHSKDANYSEILMSSKLKHTYLNPFKKQEKFNKVKALNYGIKSVKNPNSIILVLDLHLQLPKNMFDRIRKLTIQGRTAYCPILMYFACGDHEQYTSLQSKGNTFWAITGTGMMAMYKSDWDEVGGHNEKKFGTKWGFEDWEVIDRIIAKGIRVIHQRMPRFYHIYHSKDRMWDKNI